jgi:pyruvate dehydrogenase E1 component alpha subunit
MMNSMSQETAENLYRTMRRIRRFEEQVAVLVDASEIGGTCHEYVGQEAVAAGVCGALRPDDIITSTHRGHGHIIAKGGAMRHMMAELMGRTTGYNKGRGGSMHIADVSLGIYGANGMVAAGAPMCCGAAFHAKRQGLDRVSVPFFGDGAINQGVLHESLNLAAIWNLPVVFACENNMYAITTPLREVTKVEPHQRASGYGMPTAVVDGMDVEAVYTATREAVERARSGGGPTFIEYKTYRFVGHYTSERRMKTTYRTKEEVEEWRKRDPLPHWAARLADSWSVSREALERIDAAVEEELEAAIAYARQSPWPDPATALDYMYNIPYPELPSWGHDR